MFPERRVCAFRPSAPRRCFLFLVWPYVITPSVPSTVGFFVFGNLGFVLQGHSNLVQTEQQAGAGERINRKLVRKTVRERNCAALQIDSQLESTGLGTRHKVTNLCRRESHEQKAILCRICGEDVCEGRSDQGPK